MATLDWAGTEPLFQQDLQIGWADRDPRNPQTVRILDVQQRLLGRVYMGARNGTRYMPNEGDEAAFTQVAGRARARGLFLQPTAV